MQPWIAALATVALMYRAYTRKSLTTGGIVAAALTAVAHAIHPWNLPFVLLVVFFLAGTRATHVRESPVHRGGGEQSARDLTVENHPYPHRSRRKSNPI